MGLRSEEVAKTNESIPAKLDAFLKVVKLRIKDNRGLVKGFNKVKHTLLAISTDAIEGHQVFSPKSVRTRHSPVTTRERSGSMVLVSTPTPITSEGGFAKPWRHRQYCVMLSKLFYILATKNLILTHDGLMTLPRIGEEYKEAVGMAGNRDDSLLGHSDLNSK